MTNLRWMLFGIGIMVAAVAPIPFGMSSQGATAVWVRNNIPLWWGVLFVLLVVAVAKALKSSDSVRAAQPNSVTRRSLDPTAVERWRTWATNAFPGSDAQIIAATAAAIAAIEQGADQTQATFAAQEAAARVAQTLKQPTK